VHPSALAGAVHGRSRDEHRGHADTEVRPPGTTGTR
jgi:hypothetical protein